MDKRLDPTKLVEDAKSVISLLTNYYPEIEIFDDSNYKISKYAYGKDYHYIIKDKLKALLEYIFEITGQRNARIFVDSAPVLERFWAQQSGLGWIGKNCNLVSKKLGSFVFISEIIIDLDLDYDSPHKNHCGDCTKCIDACPTKAILSPNVLDSKRCMSYLTIENKELLPQELNSGFNNWIFGCDICQDVCPWNQKIYSSNDTKPHNIEEFRASQDLIKMSQKDWKELTKEKFNKLFKRTALERTSYKRLIRNIDFVSENKKL